MFRSKRFEERQRKRAEGHTTRVAPASFTLMGLFLGLAIGLGYAWLINPVTALAVSPASLADTYRDEYIYLVSQSFAFSGDWETASQRLEALEDDQLAQHVAALFEQYLRNGLPAGQVRNLAELTKRVGGDSPALSLFGATPRPPGPTATATSLASTATATLLPTLTPTLPPSRTPRPTLTPSPSPQPTATPTPLYRLLGQERICEDEPAPRIEVETVDSQLQPLPGVMIVVTWEGGEDRFFTGFQPGRGPGFGDFTMEPEISYNVYVAEGSPLVGGLRVDACADGTAGGWRLRFQKVGE